MRRAWTCRKCKMSGIASRKRKCPGCGKLRPARRRPAHRAVLDVPYERWVERFGERCGVCGIDRASRNFDRDHDHHTGEPRGLLCHKCNRALPAWMDVEWLRSAADYLERPRNGF